MDKLRVIIREEIKAILEDLEFEPAVIDAKIGDQIDEYKTIMEEAESRQAEIQAELDAIAELRKRAGKQYELIIDNMKLFGVAQIKSDKWVAKLDTELKHKRIAPEYKLLYNNLLSKVNEELKMISKKEMLTMKELKMKETKDVLRIEEGLFDKVKKLWKSFTGLFKSYKSFAKTVAKLPKI